MPARWWTPSSTPTKATGPCASWDPVGLDGHRGWQWSDAHDGGGKSLELINAALPNEFGQNWAASLVDGGTPGRANSVAGD